MPGSPRPPHVARIQLDEHFELLEVLERGGMSVVWRGRELRSGAEVAVKILAAEAARRPDLSAVFRNEIRTMARLDHRAIVQVHDHGHVQAHTRDAIVARNIDEAFWPDVDSPYLVMELMLGGTLADCAGKMKWRGVRATLLELLDALGHAHARGVVHRDLKPENVLVGRCTGPDDTLRLADFGIARALDEAGEVVVMTAASGTPHYMAPEQATGRWRHQGPWTDLYGLGCLSWELVCGRPPFHGASHTTERILTSQVHAPLPPLTPCVAVPAGLDDWLRSLLAKSHADRFRCVADARRALLSLGEPMGSTLRTLRPFHARPVSPADAPTVVQPCEVSRGSTEPTSRPLADSTTPSACRPEPSRVASCRDEPLVASSWRARPTQPARPCAVHPRPSVWGLRPVPLVGRERERSALWRALVATAETHQSRVVFLTGVSGVGKSRLASWLCERAEELGAARALTVRTVTASPDHDAVCALLRRMTQSWGLAGGALERHLTTWLAAALRRPAGDARTAQMVSALRRVLDEGDLGADAQIVCELVASASRQRPTVLWVDDLQRSVSSMRLVMALLSRRIATRSRTLIIAPLSSELRAPATIARALSTLRDHPATTALAVGPLALEEHAELVGRLLGRPNQLASLVVDRTLGYPGTAVELVGNWVRCGALSSDLRTLGARPPSQPMRRRTE